MTVLADFQILRRLCDGEWQIVSSQPVLAKSEATLNQCISILDDYCKKDEKQILPKDRQESWKAFNEAFKKYNQALQEEMGGNQLSRGRERLRRMKSAVNVHKGLMIHDYELDGFKGITYDIRVGDEVYLSSDKMPIRLDKPVRLTDTFIVEPGEFAIIMAHEYICLPQDLMGLISIRMTYKSKGLMNISGFHVDPGFRGRITFAVYNAGPTEIVLRHLERVFMIIFEDVRTPMYDKEHHFTDQDAISTELITSLKGTIVSPRSLDRRLRRVEDLLKYLLVPLVVAVVTAILGAVFKVW